MKLVKTKRLFSVSTIFILLLCLCSCSWSNLFVRTCTDVNEYDKYYGTNGENKKLYLRYNDIFPDSINSNATVKKCIIKFFYFIDTSYLSYLVIEYSNDDYMSEINRLKGINSDENYYIYGITGFSKDLCAIYANDFGLIYTLSDDASREIIYVDMQFCNHFTDIDYTKVIDPVDLPVGFSALIYNPTHLQYRSEIYSEIW